MLASDAMPTDTVVGEGGDVEVVGGKAAGEMIKVTGIACGLLVALSPLTVIVPE